MHLGGPCSTTVRGSAGSVMGWGGGDGAPYHSYRPRKQNCPPSRSRHPETCGEESSPGAPAHPDPDPTLGLGGGDALGAQGGLLSWESGPERGSAPQEKVSEFLGPARWGGRAGQKAWGAGWGWVGRRSGCPLLLGAELRLPLWLRDVPCDPAPAPRLAMLGSVLGLGRGHPQYSQHLWGRPAPTWPSPARIDTRAPAAGPASQQTESTPQRGRPAPTPQTRRR